MEDGTNSSHCTLFCAGYPSHFAMILDAAGAIALQSGQIG
jgi:hypothetical protein